MNVEYLHTLEASGILRARLTLKIGGPVVLMRNMNSKVGLPRCHAFLCNSKTSDFGFILTRRQFPVQLCFAVSINKSQGPSLRFEDAQRGNSSPINIDIQKGLDITRGKVMLVG